MAEPPLVPRPLRVASEWAWRLLVIGVVVAAVIAGASYLSLVVVPVIVALVATALLEPVRQALLGRRMSERWASILAFGVGMIVMTGLVAVSVNQVIDSYPSLSDQASDGVSRISDWLGVKQDSLTDQLETGLRHLQDNPVRAASGTLSLLSTTGGLLAGGLLAFVCTLFFVTDRHRMWSSVMAALPTEARGPTQRAAAAAWRTLTSYVKVTLTSAVFDSVLIGGAAAIAGLPVAFSLGVIVFLSAFIPTVGAIASGALVVLVALVTKNVATAIVLAVVVLVVQQLDANVMYPFMASRQLSIHPLASLLLVAAGGISGGIVGAFVAVPTAAMLVAVARKLRGGAGVEAADRPPETVV